MKKQRASLPPEAYLPNFVMEWILPVDGLPYLLSKTTILAIQTPEESFHPDASRTLLQPLTTDNKFPTASALQLLKTILGIHEKFDEIQVCQRKKQVAKKRDARTFE